MRLTVVLARHGPSAVVSRDRTDSHGYASYLASYEREGVKSSSCDGLVELARNADLVVHSQLIRSIETADQITVDLSTTREMWPELDEAPLPVPPIPFARLSPKTWNVVARTLWMAGYSRAVEPYRAARARAGGVVDRLMKLGEECGGDDFAVLVIGHGFMNTLIARELRCRGWQGPWLPSHQHGHGTAYAREYGQAS